MGYHHSEIEVEPPEGYLGRHAADVRGLCSDMDCDHRCDVCGLHMCQCAIDGLEFRSEANE